MRPESNSRYGAPRARQRALSLDGQSNARLQARQIFRDLIDMTADVAITERDVTVRFHHLSISMGSDLFKKSTSVLGRPWWYGLPLRFVEWVGASGLSVQIRAIVVRWRAHAHGLRGRARSRLHSCRAREGGNGLVHACLGAKQVLMLDF